jgi:stage IV sporulation protein B
MKKMAGAFIAIWIFLMATPVSAAAARMLVPVGRVIGLELRDDTVTVAAFADGAHGARAAGLQVGDRLLRIDGCDVRCAEDVLEALDQCGEKVNLVILRDGKEKEIKMEPMQTPEGWRLGIYLRQGVTGIGTVTFYDPQTKLFGALGHGVNDSKGALLCMRSGRVYDANVISVKKGCPGQPGQLRGAVTARSILGQLEKNTARGVFGHMEEGAAGEAIPAAAAGTVKTGHAVIRSTVQGNSVREYSVEILRIYADKRADGRNFLLRVTDPTLLEATGGIVQGMSGSPIIQDGKLVGAVTHVLVNDPTTGYGIFIENMLDAAA